MNNKIPVFPCVRMFANVIETRVRIYHQGQWYFTVVREVSKFATLTETTNRFNYNVYMQLLFGKVDLNITDADGNPLFELDPDQRSEQTRMLDLIKGK